MDVEEAWSGDNGFAFDGRVVELFGKVAVSDMRRYRYHLREVHVKVKGPDRKGQFEIDVGRSGGASAGFKVDGQDWPAFERLIAQVEAAKEGLASAE